MSADKNAFEREMAEILEYTAIIVKKQEAEQQEEAKKAEKIEAEAKMKKKFLDSIMVGHTGL